MKKSPLNRSETCFNLSALETELSSLSLASEETNSFGSVSGYNSPESSASSSPRTSTLGVSPAVNTGFSSLFQQLDEQYQAHQNQYKPLETASVNKQEDVSMQAHPWMTK